MCVCFCKNIKCCHGCLTYYGLTSKVICQKDSYCEYQMEDYKTYKRILKDFEEKRGRKR